MNTLKEQKLLILLSIAVISSCITLKNTFTGDLDKSFAYSQDSVLYTSVDSAVVVYMNNSNVIVTKSVDSDSKDWIERVTLHYNLDGKFLFAEVVVSYFDYINDSERIVKEYSYYSYRNNNIFLKKRLYYVDNKYYSKKKLIATKWNYELSLSEVLFFQELIISLVKN